MRTLLTKALQYLPQEQLQGLIFGKQDTAAVPVTKGSVKVLGLLVDVGRRHDLLMPEAAHLVFPGSNQFRTESLSPVRLFDPHQVHEGQHVVHQAKAQKADSHLVVGYEENLPARYLELDGGSPDVRVGLAKSLVS